MPTYRNDGNRQIQIPDINGNQCLLLPGLEVETYHIQTDPDLTELSAAPYYNPLIALIDVVSSGPGDPQTVALAAGCKLARVQKLSADLEISVYLQALANTPPVLKHWSAADPISDLVIEGKADQLIIEFSTAGSCQIVVLREL